MKILKLKSILFSLMAILMVTTFLSSCEKEIIIEEDVEGVKEIIIEEDLDGFKEIIIEDDVDGVKELVDEEYSSNLVAKASCPVPPSNGLWYYANPNQCTSVSAYSFFNNHRKQFFLYDSNWNFIAKKTTNTSTAIFTGLQPGTQYFFKVRNICGRGNVSSFTGNVWFTVCP